MEAHELHQMMQTMVDGMVMVDLSGKIVYANPAAEHILELCQDELLDRYYNARQWRQVDAAGDPYPLEQLPLAVALRERREVRDLEHGIIDSSGEMKWLSVNAAPLFDENDVLCGAIANFRDITENKQLHDDLESRVHARTVELLLANQELEEAYAQLMENAKMAALGRLAASVAHEINNPLQAVQGCIALTREELAGARREEKLNRYLDVVEEEIDRMVAIVERMRNFYRPAQSHREPTDIHAVLVSVLGLTQSQMQRTHVTLRGDWAESLPLVQANPDHLKQVFLNLILNALDAMPEGGTLHIHTTTAQMPEDGGQHPAIQIVVADTGAGIAPDKLPRIFEPFFTTKSDGSGLGLSISYTIIQAHGGRLTVESELDAGTAFTILLPVV